MQPGCEGSTMGQLKSTPEQPPAPRVRFSVNEEAPPKYSSHHFDIPDGVVVGDAPGASNVMLGHRDLRQQELRCSSIYSTMDLVPQPNFYANTLKGPQPKIRPSLEVLRKTFHETHFPNHTVDPVDVPATEGEAEATAVVKKGKDPIRFGWVTGVMIRCMNNIWGVILFLRLTWITSQAGILLTVVIIVISYIVNTITAVCVSAISTNGGVSSGGTYFMISRTLGPEMGGSMGMIFAFANALSVSLNTVGFAEVVTSLLQASNSAMVDSINDTRIVGVITVTVLLVITLAGMEWESKTQYMFFGVLILSFINYFIGTVIPPSKAKKALGIYGYNGTIFVNNLLPDYRGSDSNFFSMFAIFFPATTGILSGVNICGDLKDPADAIPKGTHAAIIGTTFSYLLVALTAAATTVRDASGNINDTLPLNITLPCSGLACDFGWNFTECISQQNCPYGLANSMEVLGQLSLVYYFITAGVFAASLSSALGYLVSTPKIFQCLCRDKIYPYIEVFAKGYGQNDEPKRANVLCYIISIIFILFGNLDAIAALISNFFLCSYAIICFACFHATYINDPGWRPSFKFHNKWVSLFGTVLSIVLMFAFGWVTAVIIFAILFLLYGYVCYKKPKLNWGSSMQGMSYNMALSYSSYLSGVEEHVKNFRPQCLVLTGPPNQRPALVDFVGSFTKNTSLMICGDILMDPERKSTGMSQNDVDGLIKWLSKRNVRSFYSPFAEDSLRTGTHYLLQASGLGKLRPNTLVMGFKANWRESSPESLEDYINTINDAFDSNFSLCILKLMEGLDVSDQLQFEVNQAFELEEAAEQEDDNLPEQAPAEDQPEITPGQQIKTVFQNNQGKKTIDVYWISDDGGLTLLVPYLFTRRRRWRKSKVRVFIIGDPMNADEGRKEMLLMLKRFRLDVSEVIVMTDSEKLPQPKNIERFESIIAPYRLNEEQQEGVPIEELRHQWPWKISDKELEALRVKSERKVKLNEIIRRNSQNAGLILVSLPVPQCDCPSALYMAWLDTLTFGLYCPTVLIRGNQQNVLTFYS